MQESGDGITARYDEQYMAERADIVEQMLNPTRTITYIKAFLLGTEYKMDKTGEWVIGKIDDKKRIFTDEGIDAVMSYVNPLLSPQAVLGSLNEKEAPEIARLFEITLMKEMVCCHKTWFTKRFIEDSNKLSPIMARIKFTIGRLVYINITRAIKGSTQLAIKEMSRRIDSYQVLEREVPQQKQGVIKSLFNKAPPADRY
jgi:hypothetical protein